MMELEAARERILALMPRARAERVALGAARGRILAERVVSAVDLPGFDNSAMDGYAVRAEDLRGASAEAPVTLRLAGRAAAGEVFAGEIASGEGVRVFTGSPLPRGADAVVMQEDTREEASQPGAVQVVEAVKPWENVRLRGEDVKRGAALGEAGDELTAARLALLAAAGLAEAAVGRRPMAGLVATGSELAEAGSKLAPGQIFESNRSALAALAAGAGAIPKIFPLVADTAEATRRALANAFEECDVVITSGGVSVGEMDFVKSAFEELGGTLEFWKVAIRPGRPFVFGRWREKFLFGLPGNPVSAFVTFLLLARPALARWQGATAVELPVQHAVLAEPLANHGDRRHFMRVKVDAEGKVRPAGAQASHMLSSLAAANGLVDLAPKMAVPAGALVKVLRWD